VTQYLEKLNHFSRKNWPQKVLLTLIWKITGMELPPFKFMPLMLVFILAYASMALFVSIFVTGIPALLPAGMFDTDVLHARGLYFLHYLVSLILLFTVAAGIDADNHAWYDETQSCSRLDVTQYSVYQKQKNQYIFFAFGIVFLLTFVLLYQMAFVKYAATVVSLIFILESVKRLWLYRIVSKWVQVPIVSKHLDVQQRKEIFSNLSKQNKKSEIFTLRANIRFRCHESVLTTCDVYADMSNRVRLFHTDDQYAIRQWMKEHDNVENVYVNPDNCRQAVLCNDVLTSSYLKQFIAIFFSITIITLVNALW